MKINAERNSIISILTLTTEGRNMKNMEDMFANISYSHENIPIHILHYMVYILSRSMIVGGFGECFH